MTGKKSEKPKKRAMTSEQARRVRQAGHNDAKEFALLIGLSNSYQNNPQAKKDVVDLLGDTHSVKSGKKKWQIFLHSHSRFERDSFFKRLNGLGSLFLACLDAFPASFEEYKKNKLSYKEALQRPMKKLKERLKNRETLKAFIEKSFFNAGEVTYLTIKHNGAFHIFYGEDVAKTLADNIVVENSKARQSGQLDSQKVIFKSGGKTIGEIEMRNDSPVHFREIKFWMQKEKTLDLLQKHITKKKKLKPKVIAYGKAIKTFRKY